MIDAILFSMITIGELLTRGVDTIYPSREALETVLQSGKKLRLYQGFDPTGTQLHIGHAVGFMKHRQFQELGHEVIFLIGDGTGQAGDPSGKKVARDKFYTREELRENAKDYIRQAGKIVRFDGTNPVKVLYNGDWLTKLGYTEILDLAGNFSVQQLLERDMFQERMSKGETVNLREFIYPLLQGYDSVAMEVDLELGGTDQTFNMLVGRTLVKNYLNKEKFVMTLPLLTDGEGKKIGKTEGNVIGITDAPNDLYGKIMSLPDSAIGPAFELITPLPIDEVRNIQEELKKPISNPMDYKKKLARTLVAFYNTEEEADAAQRHFEQTFQERAIPANIPTLNIHHTEGISIVDFLDEYKLVESKNEAKRLVQQKAVDINGSMVEDIHFIIEPQSGMTIKIGKNRFVKIEIPETPSS